jgi:hypothetical protein
VCCYASVSRYYPHLNVVSLVAIGHLVVSFLQVSYTEVVCYPRPRREDQRRQAETTLGRPTIEEAIGKIDVSACDDTSQLIIG